MTTLWPRPAQSGAKCGIWGEKSECFLWTSTFKIFKIIAIFISFPNHSSARMDEEWRMAMHTSDCCLSKAIKRQVYDTKYGGWQFRKVFYHQDFLDILKCYSLIGFQQYNCWLYFEVGILNFDEVTTQTPGSLLKGEWIHNRENISRLQFASDNTQKLFSTYYHDYYHYMSCRYFSISLINIWMLQGLLPL